jgi:hypothetical protein
MRALGLERSGTSYPITRLHTPETLITQPLITSCHLMSAKVSCFVCQQLPANLCTRVWLCASHICRTCLRWSQPRSRWAQDARLLSCVQEQPCWCQLSVLSGKRCDYRVGLKPSTAAIPSLSPLTGDITQSYQTWRKSSLNILRFILQFELISSKSVFQKYNSYILL